MFVRVLIIFILGFRIDMLKSEPSNNYGYPYYDNPSLYVRRPLEDYDESHGYDQNLSPKHEKDGHIIHPCRTHDLNCIRKFFGSQSYCTVSYGHVPEPLYWERSIINLIKFNITLVLSNIRIWGLNAPIETFYVNKKTNNLVMAVKFKAIKKYNEMSDFYFHRVAKEPIIGSDYSNITYGPTIITAVIPLKHGLDLRNAMITSYIFDGNPPYIIGPRVFENLDPNILNIYNTVVNDSTAALQEAFFSDGPFYFRTFLQYTICDFGIRDD